MGYFSGQLRRIIEEGGYTQSELADGAKISQGQFSKYLSDTSQPDSDSLSRLCAFLPREDQRTELAIAYLMDSIPECARELIEIVAARRKKAKPESSRVREEVPTLPLPISVREAFDYFERRALHDPEVEKWIVSAYKLIKGE